MVHVLHPRSVNSGVLLAAAQSSPSVLLPFKKRPSTPLKVTPRLSPLLAAGTRSVFIEKCNIEVHHVTYSSDGNWA